MWLACIWPGEINSRTMSPRQERSCIAGLHCCASPVGRKAWLSPRTSGSSRSVPLCERNCAGWVGKPVRRSANYWTSCFPVGRHRANAPLSHRGVAEAVRCGWADVGVCLRLVSEEAGLDFVGLRHEDYDLCYPAEYEGDPRIQALVEAVRSSSYRRTLEDLPGYDTTKTGELQHVTGPHGQTTGK